MLPVYPISRAKSRLLLHRIKNDWFSLYALCISNDEATAQRAREKLTESLTSIAPALSSKSFETEVVSIMRIKCRRALKQTGATRLVVGGGVSANERLRLGLSDLMSELNGDVYYSSLEYCTDNAAMIAYAGCQRLLANQSDSLAAEVRPRWPLSELTTL